MKPAHLGIFIALQKIWKIMYRPECNCPKCKIPLHYSIDSEKKNAWFPFCSYECREKSRAWEERERKLYEERWHAEQAEIQRKKYEASLTPEEVRERAAEQAQREASQGIVSGIYSLTFICIGIFLVWWFAGWLWGVIATSIVVLYLIKVLVETMNSD